ncbi:MAG: ATP-binding protein [Arenicellales bacterium]
MIITHITADNLLKYSHLELTDIPRRGVITISGQNESGKSTIGETVCFALFGRTFSIDEDEITRVIRWGEPRCSVHLGFAIGDKDYEIARFLDNEGNHGARLYPAGDEEHPFAKGINAVSEALDELLGYQFEEFVESFYLAQREITTPHPHSHAVKTMAGISALEKVAQELSVDLKNEQRKQPDIDEQINAVEDDIKALKIEPGKLNGLEIEVDTIRQVGDDLQKHDEELNKAAQNYRDALPRFKSARTMKRFTGLMAFITFLVALLAGVGWYLFNKMPDSSYTQKLHEFLNNIPAWNEQYILQLGIIFAISGAAFLVFWLISYQMKRKSTELQKNGELLATQLQAVSEVINLSEEETVNISDLSAIRNCNLSNDRSTALVEPVQQLLENTSSEQQKSQQMLEDSLSKEQGRLAKVDALMGVISNLNEKLDDVKHRIQLRVIADELITGAGRHFSQRFNKDLRELASRTLPLFTEERYEHLHIGDDLSVRAFSSLKRDYMDLDEISSGTQRQIMLAVRLALSQELVNTTGGGDQFIFLDEPFAFFDETRTRNAMAILPKLSEEINQIWVIAQAFPEDTHYDRAIVCSREYDSLPPEDN